MGMIIQMGRFAPPPGLSVPTSFDFYISPTGSNSNDGLTPATAWAITALSTKSQIASKTVGLLDGTYVLQNGTFSTAAQLVAFGGSSGAYTIVKSVNPRGAVLTGFNGSTYSEQALIGTKVNFVTFDGLTIQKGVYKLMIITRTCRVKNCDLGDLDVRRSASPVYGDNCEPIRIEDLDATGSNPTNIEITNNNIHDIYNKADGTADINAAGIKTYAVTNILVQQNTFTNAGIGFYCKYNTAAVTFERNFVATMSIDAIQGMGGQDQWSQPSPANTYLNYCRNNIMVNCAKFADCGETGTLVALGQQTLVYSNSIYVAANDGGIIARPCNTQPLFTCYDNAIDVATTTGYGNIRFATVGDVVYCDYNRTANFRQTNDATTTYTAIATWRSANGFDTHSSVGAIGFTNPGGLTPADYIPTGGSALRGAGRFGANQGAWDGIVTQIGKDW